MKTPMTKNEAIANIKAMRAETPKNAMKKILQMAIGGFGNLSDEARKVYTEELEQM